VPVPVVYFALEQVPMRSRGLAVELEATSFPPQRQQLVGSNVIVFVRFTRTGSLAPLQYCLELQTLVLSTSKIRAVKEVANVAPVGSDSNFFLLLSPLLPSLRVTMVPRNLAPSIEVIKFPLRSTDLKREAEYVAGYVQAEESVQEVRVIVTPFIDVISLFLRDRWVNEVGNTTPETDLILFASRSRTLSVVRVFRPESVSTSLPLSDSILSDVGKASPANVLSLLLSRSKTSGVPQILKELDRIAVMSLSLAPSLKSRTPFAPYCAVAQTPMRWRNLTAPLFLPPQAQQVVGLKGTDDVAIKASGGIPLQYCWEVQTSAEAILKTSFVREAGNDASIGREDSRLELSVSRLRTSLSIVPANVAEAIEVNEFPLRSTDFARAESGASNMQAASLAKLQVFKVIDTLSMEEI